MKLTLTTIDVEGKSQSIGQADTVILTQLTDRTAQAKLKQGDVVIGTARRELSPDGKTLAITYTGIDPEGGQVSNIAIYTKQK